MNIIQTLRVQNLKKIATISLKRNFGACSILMVNSSATDPIQKLFLEKLKDYSKQSAAQGGKMVGATAESQKEFDETLLKIKRQHGADKADFTAFPAFNFQEPKLDPIDMEEKQ